jgi:hypothetical protein
MRPGICAFQVTPILVASSVAQAATFSATAAKDGKGTISLSGEIAQGDTDALKIITETANNARHLVAVALLWIILTVPVLAADATCSDYLAARREDRSLFDGFIYGFVSAKLEGRSDAIINSATLKVKDMTTAYCIQRPKERVNNVIATFVATVARILPEQ